MLLRQFYELARDAEAAMPAAEAAHAARLRRSLEAAQRFVFRSAASEAVQQLVEKPEALDAAKSQLFAPFPSVWMEWEGTSHAVLWMGEGKGLREGVAFAVTRTPAGPNPLSFIPFRIDLDAERYIHISQGGRRAAARAQRAGLQVHDFDELDASGATLQVGRVMLASWALLATKGMTASVAAEMEKVNRSRQRKGLYPLLAYTEIRLNLDAERAVKARRAVGTGEMPLHPVRAHLRLLPTGRVVIISAHMRGNPERGVRGHHYTVVRDEDVSGDL